LKKMHISRTTQIADALPPNARLGPKLQGQLQRALQHEKHVQEEQEREQAKKRKLNADNSSTADNMDMDTSKDNTVSTTTNTTKQQKQLVATCDWVGACARGIYRHRLVTTSGRMRSATWVGPFYMHL
jgi:hypothetical protein